jgi:hypothetical protein
VLGIRPPSSCHQLRWQRSFRKPRPLDPYAARRAPSIRSSSSTTLSPSTASSSSDTQRLAVLVDGPHHCAGTPTVRSGVPPSIVTRSRSRSATAPRSRRSRAPWRFGRSRPTKVCGARRAENPHAAGPQRQSEQGRPEEATFCADSHRLGRGTVSPLGASTDSPLRPLLESNSSPPAPAPAASSPKRS